MAKFLIRFLGTPKGGLNAAYKQRVRRVIETKDGVQAAAFAAYETHDHIESEMVERVADSEPPTPPIVEFDGFKY